MRWLNLVLHRFGWHITKTKAGRWSNSSYSPTYIIRKVL